MMVLDNVLEVGEFEVNLNNTKVIKMKVSMKDNVNSDWFGKDLDTEIREFYITLDVDNNVTNIYDSTYNLHNFGVWDPNKTMLYKQLVNACMVYIIENS